MAAKDSQVLAKDAGGMRALGHEAPASVQWVTGTEVIVASQTQGEGTGRAVLQQLPATPKQCPVQAQGMKAISLHPHTTLAQGDEP